MSHESTGETKACVRCGAPAVYSREAVVPGDPSAPSHSHRATAHARPAWTCIACGHIEPEERRTARSAIRHYV